VWEPSCPRDGRSGNLCQHQRKLKEVLFKLVVDALEKHSRSMCRRHEENVIHVELVDV
jgi:hypothetical protein